MKTMTKPDWDHYFHSHYRPIGNSWGKKDLEKYRKWYVSWINYFEKDFHFVFKNKTAIELGCGIGAFCSLLADRGCQVTGSDISRKMIEHAAKVNPGIPFIHCDILKKPSVPKKYDYVFAFEVLEHLSEPEVAIENIKNMLNKDGWFIGSTPYPYPKNMQDPTHVNVHKPEYWQEAFRKIGFTKVKTHPISILPLIWKRIPTKNPLLPFYIPFTGIVSTTLVFAQR